MFDIMTLKKLRPIDLARLLGISTSSVSNWKLRNTDPPAEYLLLICEFIGVSIDELLGGSSAAAQKNSAHSPLELARAAFFTQLTEEHISLIHCYCMLSPDEQATVWDGITRLQAAKKGLFSGFLDSETREPPSTTTA